MPSAIRVHEAGGPEKLVWEQVEVGAPGPGEVRLKHTAIGVNFIDIYQRSGLYKLPTPFILGSEGAGVIEAVGDGVSDLKVGDRVAYAGAIGGYSEARLIPAGRVVKLPAGVSDEQGAAMMLQGMTVQYLIRRTHAVKPGETILIHAAAGGVGLILCQWAKHLGATVIGTVSTKEKALQAKAAGCDHPLVTTDTDWVAAVKAINNGKGLPVVYDSVGRDTFMKSLDCLAPLGLMVSFGQASGAVPPIDIGILSTKGSLFLTRPTLGSYISTTEDLRATANDLFDVVTKGVVKINVNHRWALKDAADAHRALEARQTTGSIVLVP
jgi:NADPH2:quinone reductase